MNDNQRIGASVAAARKARGLTQGRLGSLVGWTQATVWAIEKGDRSLRLSETPRLCHFLGIAPADLIADLDTPNVCPVCLGQPPAGFTCKACAS